VRRMFADCDAIFAALCEIRNGVSMHTINALVSDFPGRAVFIIVVRSSISQMLSLHVRVP
jgi:hypothetical protein